MDKQKMPLLSLQDMDFYYESKKSLWQPAVRVGAAVGINLDINRGEVLALVGESGCGKTTLGHIMVGLLRPSNGRMLFEGEDVYGMGQEAFRHYRNSVQLVQQDSYAALNPAKTLRHSLCGPLLHKRLASSKREAWKLADEALDMVGIQREEIDKYPHELSGGQRQRLLMARAILMRPKLIVADEPVSMIDVSLRIAILNLMSELNRRLSIAFVYITHDFGTARYIARNGNIAIMYLGQIVEYGRIQDVLEHPAHPYLQALLTAVPVPDPVIAKVKSPLPLKSVEMPSIVSPPSGCRFHPRCPHAISCCAQEVPQLLPHGEGLCACLLADQIPPWSLRQDRQGKAPDDLMNQGGLYAP